ncbi:MAG: hypothetical protein IT384_05105 [Deltaproteobacteria bacterium]|nr:hypothetical protein [Deltaproteobacteria bacterium]
MRRPRPEAVSLALCSLAAGACQLDPLRVTLPAHGAHRSLIVVEHTRVGSRAFAIDASTGEGSRSLELIAHPSIHAEAIEWAALSYAADLGSLCLTPGALEILPDGPTRRALPTPDRAELRQLGRGVLSDWVETATASLPEFVTEIRIERCARPPSRAVQIASGNLHSCALLEDGSIWCWGSNEHGQLGDGTTENRSSPVRVYGLEAAERIALGDNTSCALQRNRRVFCWGENDYGQLGRPGPSSPSPVRIVGFEEPGEITLAETHGCACDKGGRIRCWGDNSKGQLGDGTTEPRLGPVLVADLDPADLVAVGLERSCARMNGDHSLKCWGGNPDNALGFDPDFFIFPPRAIPGLTEVAELAMIRDAQCASTNVGAVRCWGHNDRGQIGDGTTRDAITPVTLSDLPSATHLAGAGYGFCAVTSRTPLCWGRSFGAHPTPIVNMPLVSQSAPGGGFRHRVPGEVEFQLPHVCAIDLEGGVHCSGGDRFGQLGDGAADEGRSQAAPVRW